MTDNERLDHSFSRVSIIMLSKCKVKRKLEVKSIEDKYSAIIEVENGKQSKKENAFQFNIPSNILNTWIKNADKIKVRTNHLSF